MGLEVLIQECKKKNTKAQEQLYRLFSSKLFNVCLKYSRNYAEAQDNLQDGFLLIFEKINQFEHKGSFEGWLKRVMINFILQKYRSHTVFEIVTENFPETIEVEIEEENINMGYLLKIIQELPDRYRMVFNLYVLDGYSHNEIAEMMGISSGTSKSNLARAKMILKDKIENQASNNMYEAK